LTTNQSEVLSFESWAGDSKKPLGLRGLGF